MGILGSTNKPISDSVGVLSDLPFEQSVSWPSCTTRHASSTDGCMRDRIRLNRRGGQSGSRLLLPKPITKTCTLPNIGASMIRLGSCRSCVVCCYKACFLSRPLYTSLRIVLEIRVPFTNLD